jgi:hypothetical protein
MKFRINQDKNKIAKSTLAIVLAGSFAFSPTFTFAAQESDEEGTNEEIEHDTFTTNFAPENTYRSEGRNETTAWFFKRERSRKSEKGS